MFADTLVVIVISLAAIELFEGAVIDTVGKVEVCHLSDEGVRLNQFGPYLAIS